MTRAEARKPEELLAEAAARLKREYPGMSLRSVAARLEVTPSYWSKVLRGKKPISKLLLARAVKVLRMDSQQVARLQRAILQSIEERRLAPATGIHTSALDPCSPVEGYQSLDRAHYWLLSDWHYIPILNLVTATALSPTAPEIARLLGIDRLRAEQAIRRLEAASLLRREKGGRLARTEEKLRFPTDRSLPEIRRYHQLMLQKAREELARPGSEEDFRRRLISSVSFVGPEARFAEAKLIIEEAMYRVANLMADSAATDELFHLGVQFLPLTKR